MNVHQKQPEQSLWSAARSSDSNQPNSRKPWIPPSVTFVPMQVTAGTKSAAYDDGGGSGTAPA